jgi:hypothetical protein
MKDRSKFNGSRFKVRHNEQSVTLNHSACYEWNLTLNFELLNVEQV